MEIFYFYSVLKVKKNRVNEKFLRGIFTSCQLADKFISIYLFLISNDKIVEIISPFYYNLGHFHFCSTIISSNEKNFILYT